jgi:site-specific DNA-methyltransferase (adenine-specific)
VTVTLYHGDCLEVMRGIPDASVDAVVTDPPYGIGYASSRTTRMDGTPKVARSDFGVDVLDTSWLTEAHRLTRDGGALYVFTRWDVIGEWRDAIRAAGFTVRQRIVWDKRHWGMGDLRYYGSQVEDVLFATKGAHAMLLPKREGNLWSVWKGEVWRDGYEGHPTQKPVALMQKPIEASVSVGGVVLDPFMGVGTTGVACVNTDRDFIGIERDAGYFAIAQKRIEAAQLAPRQLELTA